MQERKVVLYNRMERLTIKVVTNDNHEYDVPLAVLQESKTLKQMYEERSLKCSLFQ